MADFAPMTHAPYPRGPTVVIGLVFLFWPVISWFFCQTYKPLGYEISLGGGLLLLLVSIASELAAAVVLGVSAALRGKGGRPDSLGIAGDLPLALGMSLVVAVLVHVVLATMLSCPISVGCTRGI